MKKELISAFVDSELDEKESEQLRNENRNELKELVNIYRVIGESIQYNQSRIQISDQFIFWSMMPVSDSFEGGVKAGIFGFSRTIDDGKWFPPGRLR